MLRQVIAALALFTMAAISVSAQQPGSGPQKTKPVNLSGTVKNFEPGKTIEVEAKGAPRSYDLTASDTTYNIRPDVAVGTKVKVVEKTDATGHKTVSIEPTGKSHKPTGEKSEKPMSEKPPVPIR